MLALTFTFLTAAFLLGPDLISRWLLGFVVPRRSVSQNRGEEVTRAILWAAGPLAVAIFWVRWRHVLGLWGGWIDVRVVLSGLYSTAFFDAHGPAFFESLVRVAGAIGSLLWRLYFIVLLCALAINYAILRYRWLRSSVKSKWANAALATVVLPRVSEWHVLLSDMLLPREDVSLAVDVLTKSGTLYQGAVQDRMLAVDGSLQTLTLASPRRFLRDEFHKAKEADDGVDRESFWRAIEGELFVILGSDIASVNVRYPLRNTGARPLSRLVLNEAELESVRHLLAKLGPPAKTASEASATDATPSRVLPTSSPDTP